MQADMICNGPLESSERIVLFAQYTLQVGIQLPHMGLHDLNKQSLFIGIVIVDTSRLDTRDLRDIAERSCMISVLCKQLHGGRENIIPHRTALMSRLFFQFFLCHVAILAEMGRVEYPLRRISTKQSEFYAVDQPSLP